MARTYWGIRMNGIREGGKPYATWEAAKEALWRRADYLHHELQRLGTQEEADTLGRAKGVLLAEMMRGARQVPRPNLQFDYPVMGRGRSYRLAITREPF